MGLRRTRSECPFTASGREIVPCGHRHGAGRPAGVSRAWPAWTRRLGSRCGRRLRGRRSRPAHRIGHRDPDVVGSLEPRGALKRCAGPPGCPVMSWARAQASAKAATSMGCWSKPGRGSPRDHPPAVQRGADRLSRHREAIRACPVRVRPSVAHREGALRRATSREGPHWRTAGGPPASASRRRATSAPRPTGRRGRPRRPAGPGPFHGPDAP